MDRGRSPGASLTNFITCLPEEARNRSFIEYLHVFCKGTSHGSMTHSQICASQICVLSESCEEELCWGRVMQHLMTNLVGLGGGERDVAQNIPDPRIDIQAA